MKRVFRKQTLFFAALSIITTSLFYSCSGPSKPDSGSEEKVDTITLNHINVYLENSGSMDGYVKGSTEFEDIVYDYLARLKTAKIKNGVLGDSLKLFYINSEIIYQGDNIETFIKNLEPADFKANGGKRNNTDVSKVLEMILEQTDTVDVSIFISDCIFSPGSGNNAEQYLEKQRTAIMQSFSNYLNNYENLAVVAYRFLSNFNGLYYNKNDVPSNYSGIRPFYMWLIGSKKNIAAISSKISDSEFKHSGVQGKFVIYKGREGTPYSIKQSSGVEKDKRAGKNTISKWNKDKNGDYKLSLNVDYHKSILDDAYLRNPRNYAATDTTFALEITDPAPADRKKYSHTLKLSSRTPKKGDFTFGLKMGIPQWVYDYNDNEGLKIEPNGNGEKTFGIKYLIGGVFDAFRRNNELLEQFVITIK